jgi:hypothetical protein
LGSIPIARSRKHAKFTLIRLPLLTGHPPICARKAGVWRPFCAQVFILFPDPIDTQLKSLDHQSFRDNMVIPNNSQIQTVVFVREAESHDSLRKLRADSSMLRVRHEMLRTTMKADTAADKTIQQNAASVAENLDRMEVNSNETVKNSTRPPWLKGSSDSLLVRLALGCVVIVRGQDSVLAPGTDPEQCHYRFCRRNCH